MLSAALFFTGDFRTGLPIKFRLTAPVSGVSQSASLGA
jgi:hypothetical protein